MHIACIPILGIACKCWSSVGVCVYIACFWILFCTILLCAGWNCPARQMGVHTCGVAFSCFFGFALRLNELIQSILLKLQLLYQLASIQPFSSFWFAPRASCIILHYVFSSWPDLNRRVAVWSYLPLEYPALTYTEMALLQGIHTIVCAVAQ